MIEAKKLNKPTGGKPGFVTYTGQKNASCHSDRRKNQQYAHDKINKNSL